MVPAKLTSKIGNDKKITKKETKKIKKIINEEVRLGLHDSSSEVDDVDLTKEMFPLRHYVNDRKEMTNQMFCVIYGSKLKKMLPPVLKDMPIEELKAECLIHLLGMSSKRILSVLDGKELDSSSESDTSSEKSASHESLPLTNNNKGKKNIIKQEGCSDISDDTADVDRDLDMLEIGINKKEMGDITGDFPATSQNKHTNQKKRKGEEISTKKHKRQVVKSKSPPKKLEEKEHSGSSSEESECKNSQEKPRSSGKEKNNENVDTKQGRTLLEILELEMRARAIRALLKQDGLPEEEDTADKSSNKKIDGKDVSKTSTEKNVDHHKKKKRIYRNRSLENYDGDEKAVFENKELVTIDLTSESDTKLSKISQINKKQDEIYLRSNEAESKSTSRKQFSEVTEVNVCDNKKNVEIKSSDYKEGVTETNFKEQDKLDTNDSKKSKTESKSSWAERWLQSKDVKKVVTTSKMCANIRKRMRNARLAKQLQISDQTKPALSLEGSVSEYQLIKAGNSANEKSEDNGVAMSDPQVDSSSCNKQEKSFTTKEISNSNQNINSQCTNQPEISSDQAEIELELAPTENELNIDSMGDDVNINDNIKNKD